MADPIILDFHDSLLRKSDVRLLEHPNWLNDNLINFAYEYFQYTSHAKYSDKVAFVGPNTVQFFKLGSIEYTAECIETMGLSEKSLIFMAINDSQNASDHGTHWSMLLFNRDANSFEHYDSYGSNNRYAAESVSSTIKDHIGASTAEQKEMNCPQQVNGCDCGMYVICMTQLIADHLLKGSKLCTEKITPSTVKQSRKDWKDKIFKLGEGKSSK